MYMGSWKLDDFLTFTCNTHDTTGAATAADAAPTYRIYEDETGTPILTGTMTALDATNTTGFYSERIQLTAASGFEKGKTYTIYMSATVGGITATAIHTFQVEAEVDANTVSPTVSADVVSISGDAVAANNLEADYDGTGYNKSASTIGTVTNVTNGVTVSTNNDKTGYTLSAAGVDAIWDEVMETLGAGNQTARQIMKLCLAVLGGLSSGGGTSTVTFKRGDGTTNAVTATVDSNGNRTAVTLNI